MKESTKPNPTTAESSNLVLVVEDDAAMRDLISSWLSREKIECLTADSVDKAKALLKNQRITVTLLDWVLDRSGAEVLAFCRENHPLMPVIVMSGKPCDARTDALLNEADSFLQHPLGGVLVISHVRRWFKRLQDAPRIMLPRREEEIVPLEDIKGRYIRHVAQLLDNNASLAAKRLGIHRQTVTSVLKVGDAAASGPLTEDAPTRNAKRVAASKAQIALAIRTPGTRGGKVRKGLGAIAVMAALMTASAQAQIYEFQAESVEIHPPYVVTNGTISQPFETGITNGGRSVCKFAVTIPGEYGVAAVIKTSEGTSNSFYVNIDAEPVDPLMICDVPPQSGAFTNVVSWRGTTADGTGQSGAKFFNLTAGGDHQLIIRGLSANTELDRFMIVRRPDPLGTPAPPSGLRIASAD